MLSRTLFMTLVAAGLVAGGCKKEETCDPGSEEGCEDGQVCEEVADGEPQCFAPVEVGGQVFELGEGSAIEGARVVALDANGSPQSNAAISDADGNYRLQIPSDRDEDGKPSATIITLRADAVAYQSYPSALRQALPIDTSDMKESEDEDEGWLLSSTLTDIALIPVEKGTGTASITGKVSVPDDLTGVLVVAEMDGNGTTAIADQSGDFAIYNLTAGSYTVDGYAVGVVYGQESIDLDDGSEGEVELERTGDANGKVSGDVQIVNAPGGSTTSVILVVESTFHEVLLRGEMPPGLRAPKPPNEPSVSGSYSIAGVPPGSYVVLAAFENDGLVRDPDTSIGGTQIQHIEVSDGEISTEGFKVTEALSLTSPGANGPEAVTEAPSLRWADDSSEDAYDVVVYDAYGNIAWETTIDGESGNDPAVAYAGPLEAGMFYQFRVQSIKDGVPISSTEDLKGVFFVE